VELRGFEPLTSCVPWEPVIVAQRPRKRPEMPKKRRLARVFGTLSVD
jgi:hypothetical protein